MRIFSAAIVLNFAVLGLVGCAGDAARTNGGNSAAGSNPNAAVGNPTPNPPANITLPDTTSRSSAPDAFIPEAAIGGLAEVEMSKMAVQKAKDPEVKRFAQQMVAEHTRANNELKALATRKNVAPPTELVAGYKTLAEKLAKLDGADFDRAYMEGQVAVHEKIVIVFENQAARGVDAEAKALAAKNLPNLRKHQAAAEDLNKKLQQ